MLKHLEEPCCLLPSLLYQQWLCLGYGASWNAEGGGNKTFVNTYPQTATGDFLINCFTSISISYVESLTADDKASPKAGFLLQRSRSRSRLRYSVFTRTEVLLPLRLRH